MTLEQIEMYCKYAQKRKIIEASLIARAFHDPKSLQKLVSNSELDSYVEDRNRLIEEVRKQQKKGGS